MSEHSVEHLSSYPPGGHEPLPKVLQDLGRISAIVGVIGLGLLAVGFVQPERFFRSLLFGFHFWLCISLGSLGFVMISNLSGGGWGAVMRRFGEAAALNIWILLVAFLVLILGYKHLFPWAHIESFKNPDPNLDWEHQSGYYKVLFHRAPLYNPLVFTLRTLLYFGIWAALAVSLRLASLKLDLGENLVLRRRMRLISAAGVVLFFVTTTGYAMDFILSRETNWYSSIIGFITAVSMGLSGMSFVSLSVCYFASRKPLKDVLSPQHLNDLGNLMFALVILWMYTSFAQFLIQWNGNLGEDVSYYTHRGLGPHANGWRWVAVTLVVGHFFLPFFLLLMKGLKRKPATLARIAIWILFMRFVECLWLIAPSGAHRDTDSGGWETGHVFWTDFAAWVGVGGIWIFFYLRTLGSKRLLAQNVADQPEPMSHVAHAH